MQPAVEILILSDICINGVSGASIEEAGRFAAAMSTLKIEKSGPSCGNKEGVIRCMETAEQMY